MPNNKTPLGNQSPGICYPTSPVLHSEPFSVRFQAKIQHHSGSFFFALINRTVSSDRPLEIVKVSILKHLLYGLLSISGSSPLPFSSPRRLSFAKTHYFESTARFARLRNFR